VARDSLVERGLSVDAIEAAGLGLVPDRARIRDALGAAGYSQEEVAGSGVDGDSRWSGRICGAWEDERGRVRTIWTRVASQEADAGSKYLYLQRAPRADLPPYGWSTIATESPALRRELLIVEGLLDVHHLRAHGVENVVAVGGTSLSSRTLERLDRAGVELVTLSFDRDHAGRAATSRAVTAAARASRSPGVLVVDPNLLAPAKDPDELIKTSGVDVFRKAVAGRQCGFVWHAVELLHGVDATSLSHQRRSALARAGAWLGTLPPRLALEQEDAVAAVAGRCGYSLPAVRRAFQARFFPDVPAADHEPTRDDGSQHVALERAVER